MKLSKLFIILTILHLGGEPIYATSSHLKDGKLAQPDFRPTAEESLRTALKQLYVPTILEQEQAASQAQSAALEVGEQAFPIITKAIEQAGNNKRVHAQLLEIQRQVRKSRYGRFGDVVCGNKDNKDGIITNKFGSYEVYLQAVPGDPEAIEIHLVVISLPEVPKPVLSSIGYIHGETFEYHELANRKPLNLGDFFSIGRIDRKTLEAGSLLAIAPFEKGKAFGKSDTSSFSSCKLPTPKNLLSM